MNKNMFNSFLAEKEKAAEANAAMEGSARQGGNGNQVKFLPFFAPNKMFGSRSEVRVKILPNQEGNFFHEYTKHMLKIGDAFKQMICMDDCPLCKCIAENGNMLDKNGTYLVSPKKVYLMFVYNPYAKQIMKYEIREQGLVEILRCLKPLVNNDFDPDNDGFDIIFTKEGQYAKCVQAVPSELTVAQVIAEATNSVDAVDENNNIRAFKTEISPYSIRTTKKYVNTTFQMIARAMFPGVDVSKYLFEETEYVPQNNNMSNDGIGNYSGEDSSPMVDTDSFIPPVGNESVQPVYGQPVPATIIGQSAPTTSTAQSSVAPTTPPSATSATANDSTESVKDFLARYNNSRR